MDVDTPIGFGKYAKYGVSEIPSNYLKWIRDNVHNKPEIKAVVKEELEFRDRFDKHFEDEPI